MQNPLFVLTNNGSLNEIIAVITNPKQAGKDFSELNKSIWQAVQEHFDIEFTELNIPENWHEFHKPIDITAKAEGLEENEIETYSFTLTAAWLY